MNNESTLKAVTHRRFTVRGIRITPSTTMVCYGADPSFDTFEEAKASAEQLAAIYGTSDQTLDFTHYRVIRWERGVPPKCRKPQYVYTTMLDVEVASTNP